MKNIITLLALSIILLSCSSSTDSGKDCICVNPFVDSSAKVVCTGVSDGDSWKFTLKGEEFPVRVLHVDCFETRRRSRLEGQALQAGISEDSALALGNMAKELAISLMQDNEILMVRDFAEDNLDTYGRMLRITIVNGMRLDSLMIAKGYGLEYE